MVEQQEFQNVNVLSGINVGLRDLEERQRIMKDRILLIGQNLIDVREQMNADNNEILKEIDLLKIEIKRLKSIVSNLSEEMENTARKEEVAILSRQAKMFNPLNFARIEDVKRIINETKATQKTKK